ncbi:hypothetical protein [Burkholderia stagnalis]|uniref:hypothetical protein n=1 Tax=Burkholderia stagnalis TaxID=1503054 RepID=UPI0012D85514|nr:hypothetical protein [Burkholderia stagnalis]
MHIKGKATPAERVRRANAVAGRMRGYAVVSSTGLPGKSSHGDTRHPIDFAPLTIEQIRNLAAAVREDGD